VSFLLDGTAAVRATAVEELGRHRDTFAPIIAYVRKGLTPSELETIAGGPNPGR